MASSADDFCLGRDTAHYCTISEERMQRVLFHLLGTLALIAGSWLVHAQEYP